MDHLPHHHLFVLHQFYFTKEKEKILNLNKQKKQDFTLNPKHVIVDQFHLMQVLFHYDVTIELEKFHLYEIQMYVILI